MWSSGGGVRLGLGLGLGLGPCEIPGAMYVLCTMYYVAWAHVRSSWKSSVTFVEFCHGEHTQSMLSPCLFHAYSMLSPCSVHAQSMRSPCSVHAMGSMLSREIKFNRLLLRSERIVTHPKLCGASACPYTWHKARHRRYRRQ